ncbi:hypothetical protein LCGC14_1829460 [marine sediment metagenome]|uniref:Uncharacterized protein n=1 Tax=marine sediment metagenome TaxID=412755 RepID=A0A0F9H4N0_9ZZZZ
MEFKFDEFAVETKFRDRLDEYMPGVLLVRPARVDSELGIQVIMLDKLVEQNNPDAIAIVVRQATEVMSRKVAELQATTSRVLLVEPLQFKYVRGEYTSGGEKIVDGTGKKNGTEVFITTKIEELE